MNFFLVFLWHLATCLAVSGVAPQYDIKADNGSQGYYPIRAYVTAEGVTSPQTNFPQWSEQCDDGLLYMITPRGYSLSNPGPMILDTRGDLVWSKHFDNDFGGQAYNLMVQRYQGEDFLTFWLGDDRVRGHGSGFYYMLNSSYDIVHRVGGANGMSADLHEFLITPEGTALLTAYEIVPHDLTDLRSFDPDNTDDEDPNYIWDCVFQEVAIDTGDLLFAWRASEHVPIDHTYRDIGPGGTKNDPFDWYHVNSVEKDELGNYLISARYPHSITYINGKTSEIIWTLGGRANNFMDLSDGFATNFAWQHDARFLPTDTFPNLYNAPEQRPGVTTKLLTLFDNAAEDRHYHYGLPYSRGMLLEVSYPTPDDGLEIRHPPLDKRLRRRDVGEDIDLNLEKTRETNGTSTDYTVRLIKSWDNPKGVRSSSQGSLQVFPSRKGQDPKVLVGYGLNAVFTEFESDGTVLCDAHFGADTSWERGDIQSYRAYKYAWTGQPRIGPSVDIADDDAEVYVSWNGATEIAEWILQCADSNSKSESAWEDVTRVPKNGFETSILVPDGSLADSRYLRVIALDASGRRLEHGVSRTIDRGLIASYFPLLNEKLPSEARTMSSLRVFLIFVCLSSALLIVYEAYRRYLCWKTGRLSAGPVRWRKGTAYRLLGDV